MARIRVSGKNKGLSKEEIALYRDERGWKRKERLSKEGRDERRSWQANTPGTRGKGKNKTRKRLLDKAIFRP